MTGPNHPSEGAIGCDRALELMPTFVDGEASDALAGLVRTHLIDCPGCRMAAQEESNLKQWFEPLAGEAGREDIEVPAGFASRVTALAFAGASQGTGQVTRAAEAEVLPMAASSASAGGHERRGPRAMAPMSAIEENRPAGLGFLVGLTAAAAVLMVTFTLMLAQGGRVSVGDMPLSADGPLEEALRELEAENKAELELLKSSSAEEESSGAKVEDDAAPKAEEAGSR